MDRPLPIFLPLAMVATFLAGMLAIKFFVAPWIVAEFGWIGVVAFVIACLACGRWLED